MKTRLADGWPTRSSILRPGRIAHSAAALFSTIGRRLAHVLGIIVLACGLLAAARIAEALYAEARRGEGTPPVSPPSLARFAEGDMVARVTVARLGLEFPVFEGVERDTLAQGAGHLPGTALPGEERSARGCLIAVPRDAGPAALSDLRLGDSLEMRTPFGLRRYSVGQRQFLSPEDSRLKAGRPGVTFVTPFPADSLGPAPLRLAIVADEKVPWLAESSLSPAPRGFSLFRNLREWPSERSRASLRTGQLFHELGNAVHRPNR